MDYDLYKEVYSDQLYLMYKNATGKQLVNFDDHMLILLLEESLNHFSI